MSPESAPDIKHEASFTPEQAPVLTDPEIVNLAPVAFAITDVLTGEFMYVNDRVRKIFGFGDGPASSFNISDFYRDLELRAKLVEQLLTYGIVEAVEVSVRRHDGANIWVLGSSRLIRYQDKLCALLAVTDVTMIKQLNAELESKQAELKRYLAMTEQLQQAAENESKAKSTLLVNLTHEVRTPLNGILGMAQVLADEATEPHLKPYIEAIIESANALHSLATSILEHNELATGAAESKRTLIDPAFVITKAVQCAIPRIGSKQLEIATIIDTEVPELVELDGEKLLQALTHLLFNSIKFTEEGSVTVKCGYSLDQLSISVSDTGVGIPKSKFDDIFNEFLQLDASATRKFGGIGLGLSIAKKAVSCLDGQILVDSEEGVGSTFTIITPAPSRSTLRTAADTSSNGKAHIYSRSEAMAQMVSSVLVKAGYKNEEHKVDSWNDSINVGSELTIVDIANSMDQTIAVTTRFKELSHEQKENLIFLVHRNCAPPPAVMDSFAPIRFVIKPTDTQTLMEAIAGQSSWQSFSEDFPDLDRGHGSVRDDFELNVVEMTPVSDYTRNWSQVDSAFIRRIITMLFDTCTKCLEGINLGIERNDYIMVYTYAYQMYGSVSNAGATSTAALCRRIIDAALTKNYADAKTISSQIMADIERFQESIDRELNRKEA